MKKLGLLMVAAAVLAIAGGTALGQGRAGGHGGAAGGGWSGGAPGGWHGGGGQSGAWHGGGWHGGGWYGGGYRGWYGPRVGIYFGAPLWWGGYPYAYPYPGYYAYPGYYPYPVYLDSGPVVYIQKPPVAAAAPPPAPPAARAPAPKLERYTLSAKELFAFDRADLRMPQPKLDEIAIALVNNPQITGVTITGYTDRLGSYSYNLGLSQRRAEAVKSYLVGKGVAAKRLIAIGRGKANPVAQCEERAQAALIACLEPNRRVEIEQFTIERPIG